MSSSGKQDSEELKAGHPPAVKAGGMRVVSKAHGGHAPSAQSAAEAEAENEVEATPEDTGPLLVSGVVAKGHKDFPKEAVKAYHEKPVAHIEKRPQQTGQQRIQQPQRKS